MQNLCAVCRMFHDPLKSKQLINDGLLLLSSPEGRKFWEEVKKREKGL